LWQPVVSGKAHLTQFLRLKIAADAMAGQARTTTQQIIDELARGRSVEVAGYALPSAIALPMAQAQLGLPADGFGPIDWIEVAQGPAPTLLPASTTIVGIWHSHGASIRARAITGPQFWQTQEIEVCEALIDESLRFADAVT
jgi:exosortase A-associated hydrolase 2